MAHIHSVEMTAANVHDLNPAADLLYGEEEAVYDDVSYFHEEASPPADPVNCYG
jgi:IS5 family transposase